MPNQKILLRLFLAVAAIAQLGRPLFAEEVISGRVSFRVRETAGLRRFGYPVHAILPKDVSSPGLNYWLLRDGKEVAAQFRKVKDARSPSPAESKVALDFTTSPGPFEVENYVIEYGTRSTPGLEPKSGLAATRNGDSFRITNGPQISYTIPEDLTGLVSSIKTPKLEFLAPRSRGLFLIERSNRTKTPLRPAAQEKGANVEVTRQGPIAVGLGFEGTVTLSNGKPLRTSVDLDFVNSKSWIEASWIVEDPENQVECLGVDLEMKIDSLPALVDCGASSTVYSHLARNETLSFAGLPRDSARPNVPGWIIEQGENENRRAFASADANAPRPEGWIHLMDRDRCSALAVADFAKTSADRFLIEATGRMEFQRRYETADASSGPIERKALKFWLHVVPMPVQIGAVTSPQAMLAPLAVEWKR